MSCQINLKSLFSKLRIAEASNHSDMMPISALKFWVVRLSTRNKLCITIGDAINTYKFRLLHLQCAVIYYFVVYTNKLYCMI